MKKKIIAMILTLILIIGSSMVVYAESVYDDQLYPEEFHVSIELPGVSPTRGPIGGGYIPPPLIPN